MTLQRSSDWQWLRKDCSTLESRAVDGADGVGDVVIISVNFSGTVLWFTSSDMLYTDELGRLGKQEK